MTDLATALQIIQAQQSEIATLTKALLKAQAPASAPRSTHEGTSRGRGRPRVHSTGETPMEILYADAPNRLKPKTRALIDALLQRSHGTDELAAIASDNPATPLPKKMLGNMLSAIERRANAAGGSLTLRGETYTLTVPKSEDAASESANTPAPTPEPAWVDPFLKLYED